MGARGGGGSRGGRAGGGSQFNMYAAPKGERAEYNFTPMGGRIGYSVTWNGTGHDGKSQTNMHVDGNYRRMQQFIKKNLKSAGYVGN